MVDARRKEERERIMQHVNLVGLVVSGVAINQFAAEQFIRLGSLPEVLGPTADTEDSPEVAAKEEEFRRTGRFTVG